MTPDHDGPAGPGALVSPGRRSAVRALAAFGTAMIAMTGRSQATSASSVGEIDGPAGPASPAFNAARKKKGKRGPTGPTGPTGAGGTLTQNSASKEIPVGGNDSAQANCLSGQATGGGASLSNTNCELVSSNVIGTSAWGATGKCSGENTATLTVRVICLG